MLTIVVRVDDVVGDNDVCYGVYLNDCLRGEVICDGDDDDDDAVAAVVVAACVGISDRNVSFPNVRVGSCFCSLCIVRPDSIKRVVKTLVKVLSSKQNSNNKTTMLIQNVVDFRRKSCNFEATREK